MTVSTSLLLSSYFFALAAGGESPAVAPRGAMLQTPEPPEVAIVDLSDALEQLRAEHGVPGMVALVARQGAIVGRGAAGVRKLHDPTPITTSDLMHIGSCTKAMTAVLAATLVEQGKLHWSSSIKDVFPQLVEQIHADYRDVTLRQLLWHRAGLPANGPWWQLQGENDTEKRVDLLKRICGSPAACPAGTYQYSNVGYALVGLMAEQVTGQAWESLLRERVFKPLNMTAVGFGPPGAVDKVDQPWGHSSVLGILMPRQFDNASPLGPAGRVHCSLADWARFANVFTHHGRAANPVVSETTLKALLALPPAPFDKLPYAGGWIIGEQLKHDGSNTTWYASALVDPKSDLVVLVAANSGHGGATRACQQGVRRLPDLAPAR